MLDGLPEHFVVLPVINCNN